MKRIAVAVFITLALAACQPEPQYTPTPTRTPGPDQAGTPAGPGEVAATPTSEAPTVLPTPTLFGRIGPDAFPPDVNPLTGLVVDDPAVLERPPLLIKVSNAPGVVIPQSGLQSADHVWEHIMEGWHVATRFTAVFLGETPDRVGSVRSGRPPDLELVPMYEGIFMASGFSTNRNAPGTPPRMRELMLAADWVDRNFSYEFGYREPFAVRIPREGVAVEHTLFAVPAELWRLAEERFIPASSTLTPGFLFDAAPPDGGTPTSRADILYPGSAADATWQYSETRGAWLRWTNGQEHQDALTGLQLGFENVVVLYAEHYNTDFIEDEGAQLWAVGADLTGVGNAVLLRDGQRYDVTWRRDASNRMIQFFGADGEQIAFKPGKTWFCLVSTTVELPEVRFE
jgi:hypothetical protein